MPQEVTIFYAYGGNLNLDGPADGENQYSTHSNKRSGPRELYNIWDNIKGILKSASISASSVN